MEGADVEEQARDDNQQQFPEAHPHPAFDEFVATIAALRSENGCPWDREQTHRSIAKNMLEEASEAVGAIEDDDVAHMCEEFGDVLLEVVLQSQIAQDAGEFDIDDVIEGINAKMVRRHPHVFGVQKSFEAAGIDPESISTADDVLDMWDVIKAHERKMRDEERRARRLEQGLEPDIPEGLLDGVPRQMPALMQAQEVSRKAVKAGFAWDTEEDVWQQVYSEIDEFKAAEPGSEDAAGEFGDILFSLVNVALKQGIDAEGALRGTCGKFRRRWESIEEDARAAGEELPGLSLEAYDAYWKAAKAKEQSGEQPLG